MTTPATEDTLRILRLTISALSFVPPTEGAALMLAKSALDDTDMEITRTITRLEDLTVDEAAEISRRLEAKARRRRVHARKAHQLGRYARYGGYR